MARFTLRASADNKFYSANTSSGTMPFASSRGPAEHIPAFLELDAVSRTYAARDGEPVQAVASVSCAINAGEFISIIGPSGCGKSTLLTMIAGLLVTTTGQVLYRGNRLEGPHDDFGIVFQDPVLFPWRTVRANVELPAEVSRMPRSERTERAMGLIKLVGLEGFENKFPQELSGGMQQRVAICRALMLTPSVLLMDEPFGALDAMTREQMNLEVQRISIEAQTTVIFVTHSIAEAAFLSDRVVVLTGRPSTVREIVPIDIPRPRKLELITSDRFGVYVSRLRKLLSTSGDVT